MVLKFYVDMEREHVYMHALVHILGFLTVP